ncbi:MFS transporter [Sphingomonas sp. Leaf339]|uniref:MFS transporter n=1 Tax=Sphingomonas sp. Leaf339 TaxID=1736343 RepID=UPI00070048AF|nr:MFS transporter [Sphingomonas sp. Leaf339]KQU55714.1 MFS transporter [Sphingomonas sp. Leaf339]
MSDVEQATVRRVTWRLMPFLGLLYLIAYIDRQNISYAKLQMVDALGLSEAAFGLGASLFFIGYFLFEVPSNLFLHRVGARVWFARIMASWGVVTLLLAFTPNATAFYILRFLLGVAEAGFFPGVLYVLTLWFPARHRARAVGLFMLASAVANGVGAAISGFLLDQGGTWGLAGWQWVFLATGLPAILLAPAVLFLLPRSPDSVVWLTVEQKAWLANELAEPPAHPAAEQGHALATLRDRRVLLLCLVYIGFPLAAYGLSYWLPTIVRGFGVSNTVNGFLNIIPWTLVGLALWVVPRHAAGFRNQIWHAAGPALVGAVLLVASVIVDGVVIRFVLLSLAAAAIFAGQPVFWTLPPRFLSGARAAAGFAAINSVGNLGGFVAQAVVPAIRDSTGSDTGPMVFLAACLSASALGVLAVERMLPRARAVE